MCQGCSPKKTKKKKGGGGYGGQCSDHILDRQVASVKQRYCNDLSDPWSLKWVTGPARGQVGT